MLADTINFEGHFTIQQLDEHDNVIDQWEDKNLIMDAARENMAELIAGLSNGKVINRFVIGTWGHVGSDILEPKQVGGTYPEGNFDTTRNLLYSVENDQVTSPWWWVDFTPNALGGAATIDSVFNKANGGDTTADVAVDIQVSGKETTYTVTVPTSSANNVTGDPIAYTEAGLMSIGGTDDLFSMKCFPARVKEDTVKLKIVWKIIF